MSDELERLPGSSEVEPTRSIATPLAWRTVSRRLIALVDRLSIAIEVSVVLVERGPERWRVITGRIAGRPLPSPHSEVWAVLDQAATAAHVGRITAPCDGSWTSVPLSRVPGRRVALLLAGDWRAEAARLLSIGDQMAEALRPSHRPSVSVRRAGARLTRLLVRTDGVSSVCSHILETMTSVVGARLGAIAMAEPSGRCLTIRATHGYPLVLVEHMRIGKGEGIFGMAYESGKMMRAPGATAVAQIVRRPRYRTDSYVVLPIMTGDEVLAVVSVADRLDDHAFTRSDVAALCALAEPAALALARERATARAEAFAHAAAIDSVSGLFNRRYFHGRLEEELQRSRRHEIPLALLMIDIDDFKAINDRYGHLAGDSVIRSAADIVRRAVRVFDVCTRFGGEEFAVIMPGSHEESAAAVAERIRARVAGFRMSDKTLNGLTVTVSIGLAVSRPGMAARDLISRADEALYLAKRSGKNRVGLSTGAAEPPTKIESD